MTEEPRGENLSDELARLRKRAERERRARLEAEALAEKGTRELYERTRQVQLLYSIADACARAATVSEALQVTLDEMCAFMEWPLAHAYLVSGDMACTLVSARLWHADPALPVENFRARTEQITFQHGEGLPGRAAQSGQPVWIADVTMDENFPRRELAREIGLRGAFAVPVLVGEVAVAVLEAFSREVVEPMENWSLVCTQVGIQLGRIFEREEQKEAERANQAKSEFLSRMSHELRTPLNAIIGFGQILELERLTADQHSSVSHILKGGRHLLGLIDEVLDISRIESGHMNISPEPVLLESVLPEVLALILPAAERRQIELVETAAADRVYVTADKQRLRQILLNLLSNAVKYNRDGGRVELQCREQNGRVRIGVTDTGRGIPGAKLALLFTPFERLGAEQTGVEGTGLGLALSKRLAELMGGFLSAESRLGEGTTFWLDLAAVAGPMERAAPELHELAECSAEAPACTLLYVEDNASNRQLVESVLRLRPGVTLLTAGTAREGVAMATERRPTLILLDLNLPDFSGHEAMQRLQESDATREIPVIIVSADATPGQVRRLLAAGAAAYLTKPIDLAQFLKTVDELLARAGVGRGA